MLLWWQYCCEQVSSVFCGWHETELDNVLSFGVYDMVVFDSDVLGLCLDGAHTDEPESVMVVGIKMSRRKPKAS
jgi:hypothetical protein